MKGKDKSELAEITRQFLLLSFPRMIGDRINVLRELSLSGLQVIISQIKNVSNVSTLWKINSKPHVSVDEFIQVAKEKYGYNAEQALGMLFWHKHDLDR